MTPAELAEFYRKADTYSVLWQRRYLWSERVQLVALVLVALIANVEELPAVVVVVCFAVGVICQFFRLVTKADQKWWNGRAGAESTKTLCWQYAVGGKPFPIGDQSADDRFANRVTEVATQVADLVPVSVSEAHITPAMQALRSQQLPERASAYQAHRVQDQLVWYSTKSDQARTVGAWWAFAAIGAQGLGLVVGIASAVDDYRFDYVGVFSAAGAAAVAWSAVKQYDVLARSYAVASHELSAISGRILGRTWTEPDWADFVNDAEEAISKEHTSWRASRGIT